MGISAYVFDAHGTVFDFASAAADRSDVLGETSDQADRAVARQAAALHRVARGAGRHADFWQVIDDALAFALETLGLIETGLRDQLLQLYVRLTAPGQAATIALGSILHGKLGRTARLGCPPLRSTMPVSWALCLDLRHEHRVMQPLWSKLRTPAQATQPRDRFAGGIAVARSRPTPRNRAHTS
jgi:hypothetical protein